MNYQNARLRDKLAAAYVLGTLRGLARSRFARLLKYDAGLRREVAAWEARLAPLADTVPAVTPPARVWRKIAASIGGRPATTGFWNSLGLWRGCAGLSTVFAVVLATILVARPPAEAPVSTVAVLADSKAQPVMVISWPPPQAPAQHQIRIRTLTRPDLPPGKSFELWMLPGGNNAPISLGVIRAESMQTVSVNATASSLLPKIAAMAISVEPQGGSPTGLPTGPVILSGPCVKVI